MKADWEKAYERVEAVRWALDEAERTNMETDSVLGLDLKTEDGIRAAIDKTGRIRGWQAAIDYLRELAKGSTENVSEEN